MHLSPRLRKSIRWALLIVFGPIALILLALVVMVVFRIPVPLNGLRPTIQEAATGALKRETRIEGPLKLYLGLHPAVQIEGFHIANPDGWPGGGDFVQLDRVRAKLGLINLLNKRIDIDEFHVEGVKVTLQRNTEGEHNWRLLRGLGGDETEATSGDTGTAVPAADQVQVQVQDENKTDGFHFVQVREVSIRDIELRELFADGKPKFFLALDRAEGNGVTGKKLKLSLEGALDDAAFKGDLSANPLDELIDTDNLWPFAFKGGFAGVALNLDGELASPKTSDATVINFTVEADDLKKLHPITGPLPDLGAVNLKGQATATPGGYHVPQVTGAVGETTINGQLDIKLGGETPHIDGFLDLGVLDVAIFKSDKEGEEKPAASPSPSPSPRVDPSNQPDKAILPFTGKLRLSIAELKNPKVSVKNLLLGLEASENEAVASVSVDFAEAPLAGAFALREIDLETQEVDLRLEGNGGKFGKLIAFFTEQENFEGQFEYLLYHVTGRGDDIGDAWNNRTTVLDVKKAALTFQGEEKTIDFELDRAGINGTQTGPSRYNAKGSFKGLPFQLQFERLKPERAGPDEEPYLDFNGAAAGLTWSLKGNTRRTPDAPNPGLDLNVFGENLGLLAPWSPVSPDANLPYAVTGRIFFDNGGFLIKNLDANVGSTTVTGEVGNVKSNKDDPGKLVARINADTVDVREIATIFPGKEAKNENEEAQPPPSPSPSPGIHLDMPILPQEVHLDDADFEITAGRVVFEKRELADIAFSGQIRDGWMKPAPFRVTIGTTALEGDVGIDFRETEPQAGILLSTADVNIGELLSKLEVAKGIDATAGKLTIDIHARGSTLGEILERSNFTAGIENGVWTLADQGTGAKLPIIIKSGSVTAKPDQHLLLNLDGEIKNTPLKIDLESNGLAAFANEADTLQLKLTTEIAGTKIALEGDALLPLDRQDVDVELAISSENLSRLDQLLELDLPPVGPYSLTGRFRLLDSGYSLSDIDLKIGQTDLKGNFSVTTSGKRPKIEADLTTNTLQINDFAAEGWSPRKGTTDKDKKKKAGEDEPGLMDQLSAADKQLAELLSPKVLGSFDANVNIRVGKVASGKDQLGRGSLKATVDSGRLTLGPVEVELPGGKVIARYMYHPGPKTFDGHLTLKTEALDFGVLARRKDPTADDVGGLLYLDIDVKTNDAPMDDDAFGLGYATGRFNFEVCPRNFKAGIMDLWATNLVLAILPRLDPENKSKMNCIIGKFVLEDGLMAPEALVLDTTRIRVAGGGQINFKDRTLDLRLAPKPKSPQFFNIGAPLIIDGGFEKPNIRLGNWGVGGVIVRMAGNTVFYPVNLIFASRMPRAGEDICTHSFRAESASNPE